MRGVDESHVGPFGGANASPREGERGNNELPPSGGHLTTLGPAFR